MKICKLVFTLFVFLLFSVSYGEVVEIVGFGFFRPHETKKVGSNIYTRGGYTFTYQRPDNIFFGQVVALRGRFNGKKGLTTWPGKEQGYYWAGSSYKSMNHPISTNLQVRYPAVDLCLLDAVWADELTVNKVGDDYHATYKIFIRKLQKVCNDPEKTSEWVDGQTIATGSGVHPDSEVAKCLARKNAITTSLQNGLTVHDVVSDNPCGDCDNQSMDVYIPPMAMIESCEPCDLAKNTTSNSGDVFQNGFSSCLSCSGGSMTLGGHYHVNFATVNSNMGYGWKNDFDIRVGKIMALDGSETYVFTQGGNRKFFARDVASGGFLPSSTDSQIDIVEDTSGVKTLNIKLGNNLYEFDVPTANGVLGEKTVKRSTQIMYEDFDDLGFFSYKGYSVTYTYDVNNRLSKIENETGEFYTFQYDLNGLLETVKDSNGENVRSFTYDANNNLVNRWQRGLGTTAFRYTSIDGNSHILVGVDKPGSVSLDFNYEGVSTTTDIYGETQIVASYTKAETAYSGPQTLKTYYYIPEGRSYTEYQRPLFENGEAMQYAIRKEYDPVNYTHPIYGSVTKNEAVDEYGAVTISYSAGMNNKILWEQTTGTDGKVKTSKYEYDDQGNRIKSITRYASSLPSSEWDEYIEYDSMNRITMRKGRDGVEHHVNYRELSLGSTNQIEGKWDEKNGQVVNKITYEYYAETDPAYRKFRLWKENRHLNESTIYTIEYNYISSDPDNPQNVGKLWRKTYPDASYEEWSYDCCNIATYRNRQGGVASYIHDAAGRVSSETAPSDAVTQYTYDDAGRVLTKVLPSGGTISYTYNAQGNLVRTDYPDSSYETSTYSTTGMLLSSRAKPGLVTNYEYNTAGGNLARTYTSDGNLEQLTYDGLGRQSTTTDARGLALTYVYDDSNPSASAFGNLWKTVWPDSTFTESLYNSYGQRVSAKDRMGYTSTFEYDNFGRLTASVAPNGVRNQMGYDNLSRVIQQTITDTTTSLSTTYTLDFEGKATQISYPDGTSESRTYTGTLLTATTDRAGKTWTYTYTSAGQPDQVIAPDSLGVVADYDYITNGSNIGQLLSQTGADGMTVTFTYDNMGRVTRQTMPDSTYSETEYSPAGATAQIDRSQRRTEYTYDSYGRLTKEKDPAGRETEFAYNLAGNLTTLTDARDSVTTWTYNTEGFVTRKTYADSSHYDYTYNVNGKLVSRTDARGRTTAYAFNNVGQLTTIDYPNDADISCTYDSFGRRTNLSDASGATSWTYDAYGRLTGENGPFSNDVISYSYDSASRKASLSLNGSNSVAYSYDSVSRLNSVTKDANVFAYSYQGTSTKVNDMTLNSNLIVDNSYDTLGRLTQKVNKTPGGTVINSYNYTLNNADQRTRVTFADGKYISYDYNLAGEVTGVQMYNADASANNTYKYGFNYDAAGNPTQRETQGQTRSYTFNNLNQFVSATAPASTNVIGKAAPPSVAPFTVKVNSESAEVYSDGGWVKQNVALLSGANQINIEVKDKFNRSASTTKTINLGTTPVFTYDANGNMTSDDVWTYTWNDENRLVSAVKPEASKVEFTYDSNGRMRIKKEYTWNSSDWSLNKETHFVYDDKLIIAELDGTDTVKNTYLWGISLSGDIYSAGGVGGLLVADMDGSKEFPAYDGNGNVTAYTNAAGAILSRQEYSPFGALVSKEGSSSSPFFFSTIYLEPTTNLYCYLYRKYNPSLGRWLSRDPIEEQGGINLYAMVSNNPISKVDYLGTLSFDCGTESSSDWKKTDCETISTTAKAGIYDLLGMEVGLTVKGKFCNCCNKRTGETRTLDYADWGAEAYVNVGFGIGVTAQLPVVGKYELMIKGPGLTLKHHVANFVKKCGEEDYKLTGGLSITGNVGGTAGASAWLGISVGYNANFRLYGYVESGGPRDLALKLDASIDASLTVKKSIGGIDFTGEFFKKELKSTGYIRAEW